MEKDIKRPTRDKQQSRRWNLILGSGAQKKKRVEMDHRNKILKERETEREGAAKAEMKK